MMTRDRIGKRAAHWARHTRKKKAALLRGVSIPQQIARKKRFIEFLERTIAKSESELRSLTKKKKKRKWPRKPQS